MMQICRRKLIAAAGSSAICSALPRDRSEAAFAIFQAATIPTGFPGQASNPVGFAATPSGSPSRWGQWVDGTTFTATWPGVFSSLTTWTHGATLSSGAFATSGAGTLASPYVFAFFDFVGVGTTNAALNINLANSVFVGCRFQSNDQGNHNVSVTVANVNFYYCSFTPLISLVPNVPFPGAWPSASAGQNVNINSSGASTTYMVPNDQGYEYGVHFTTSSVGVSTIDHCDIWGHGNAVVWEQGTTTPFIVSDTWMHDSCVGSTTGASGAYHNDGPGYLNSGTAPGNITISHCTIAFMGNTNLIAFQAATNSYNALVMTNNYCSGNNNAWAIGTRATGTNTNCTFTGNILSTDLWWVNNAIDAPLTSMWNIVAHNNTWRNNTLLVVSGTSYGTGGSGPMSPVWSGASNGLYILPDNTLNAVDWSN